jgi:hypothetical protein
MDVLLTGLNSLTSTVFALVAYRQFFQRRKLFQLVWCIGLTTFSISATCELILTATGQWTEWLYIVWYLTGAMLGAVYFGQGTAYFLMPSRWAHGLMAVVVLLSIYGIYLTFAVPLDLTKVYPAIPSGNAFPKISEAGFGTPRWLTPFLNTYGFLLLNGGALYSAVQGARQRMEKNRVYANILIAVGGALVGTVSTLNRLGYHEFQYPGETAGVILMFWGYLMSTKGAPASEPVQVAAERSQA